MLVVYGGGPRLSTTSIVDVAAPASIYLLTRPPEPRTFSSLTWWVEKMSRDTNDLLHGTLDVLVLKTLAAGPTHGYGITRSIEERTGNELQIVDSALYKALHRLEAGGAIDAEWGISDNNRRAKYYSLTAAGRRLLRAETATWKRYVAAVSSVLEIA
jgi:PadR family transcriptional regulator PadR